MDRAARCRRAARDAVADVEPPRLHDVITDLLEAASMTPGVLTLESAVAIDADADADVEPVLDRAAGVQLIYEGLRLTRSLAHAEPWADANTHTYTDADVVSDDLDADLEILAADILVARGFYLLARTGAAEMAVRTVQAFGRDQTLREQPDADAEAIDANLECDVLELAVTAGTSAVGSTPPAELFAIANDVSDAVGVGFPPATECLSDLDISEMDATPGEEAATDRATSATDS
ncbi:DUF7114 family protein [Natrialbaceae archaeon AArc-T1-2]|uniref:DUF7114 family protein n=1 Tax=Natrialbaceae archaeon AArc-T1-2 TaxID=3053904 RepID=UPI00255AF1BB|nr:hypothetical protein [Natrialbaceae archaeon AArc-T1-2]WIV68700.1 hypothetical protein QQ977_04885 [Natrialbaceae archaeon AArc-T1-2]